MPRRIRDVRRLVKKKREIDASLEAGTYETLFFTRTLTDEKKVQYAQQLVKLIGDTGTRDTLQYHAEKTRRGLHFYTARFYLQHKSEFEIDPTAAKIALRCYDVALSTEQRLLQLNTIYAGQVGALQEKNIAKYVALLTDERKLFAYLYVAGRDIQSLAMDIKTFSRRVGKTLYERIPGFYLSSLFVVPLVGTFISEVNENDLTWVMTLLVTLPFLDIMSRLPRQLVVDVQSWFNETI
jgi:hypothetical protein